MGSKKNKKNKQQSIAAGESKAQQKHQIPQNSVANQIQGNVQSEDNKQNKQLNVVLQNSYELVSVVKSDNAQSLNQNGIAVKQKQMESVKQKVGLQSLLSKQESLDTYLQLKYEFNKKDSEINELKNSDNIRHAQQKVQNNSMIQNQNQQKAQLSVLIPVQDQEIPSLDLQPSPKSIKPFQIEIISYRTAIFMKINTHFFKIKITNININHSYQIQKRFSEFADLYDQLFFNHPGYILHPFPDKNLDSFLKLKMGLSAQQNQISELIQKRMKQLEQFMNWLARHNQLCTSEELAIFITKEEKKFSEGTARLNKYVSQYKQLQNSSYITNLISKGKQILTYFKQPSELNIFQQTQILLLPQFKNIKNAQISEQIRIQKQRLKKMISDIKIFYKSEKYFSQFIGIQTDIDVLQKLCAKHVSGRTFCKTIVSFIDSQIIDKLQQLTKQIQEAEKSLIHIAQTIQGIIESKKQLNLQKKAKLQRRLQRATRNFEYDWPSFYQKCVCNQDQILKNLKQMWKQFKTNMKKIWKAKT